MPQIEEMMDAVQHHIFNTYESSPYYPYHDSYTKSMNDHVIRNVIRIMVTLPFAMTESYARHTLAVRDQTQKET